MKMGGGEVVCKSIHPHTITALVVAFSCTRMAKTLENKAKVSVQKPCKFGSPIKNHR